MHLAGVVTAAAVTKRSETSGEPVHRVRGCVDRDASDDETDKADDLDDCIVPDYIEC